MKKWIFAPQRGNKFFSRKTHSPSIRACPPSARLANSTLGHTIYYLHTLAGKKENFPRSKRSGENSILLHLWSKSKECPRSHVNCLLSRRREKHPYGAHLGTARRSDATLKRESVEWSFFKLKLSNQLSRIAHKFVFNNFFLQ